MNAPLSARDRVVHAVRSVLPQAVLNWREAQYYARYGEVELHFLDILCDPEKDALDVGANDGCYIHFLRRTSRYVHAFEPIPWLAQMLRHKFSGGVTIHPIALSNEEEGMATLHMPEDDGTLVPGCSTISGEASATYSRSRDISVPIDTLDHAYSGEAGFIKIDVEGHEERVLDGARGTIARCRPAVLIEVIETFSAGCAERITSFFEGLDYQGVFVFRRRLVPARSFDPTTMQRDEDRPALTASLTSRERFGPYVYNFMFLPNERAAAVFEEIEERMDQL